MKEKFEDEELRVIRVKRLQDMLGISRSTIYSRVDPKSKWFDPDFPKPFKIGGYAVGWDLREVVKFVEMKKMEAR
ncbi:AlpA family phage regulatory protein [Pseudomonas sp. WS 5013]|uniref:helix-turn-helix transcriptional regulator n=1 Tax=Pseudomonas sp. WS 5013 TaxID=2717475 RepID=UPI0014737600|nr:AlpA family phage regulatory protein [Pseudomonas sp. WS 5013]NMY39700.1 AlpA family phage regulatory protein [Pseudomonas sp. WS 5013]